MTQAWFNIFGSTKSVPRLLAPLAGVSDAATRRIAARYGANLTFVEMLSAAALERRNPKTLGMLDRHPDEGKVGVQLTGRTPEEVGRGVAVLDDYDYDVIDLNMGCPVQKIVKTGCGAAILKDLGRVKATVAEARRATKKPLSVKIRLGWDWQHINALEVAKVVEEEGADWLTVHGRTRSDDYGRPANLEWIARIKEGVSIPVIGNGDLFSDDCVQRMSLRTNVDGVMFARGALGSPWVFNNRYPSSDEWKEVVHQHLTWHEEAYGVRGIYTMRKHLLWYARGFRQAKALRTQLTAVTRFVEAHQLIDQFSPSEIFFGESDQAFDPKETMDRHLDRGVGHEDMV